MMKARVYFIDEGLPDCSEKHAEDFVRKVFAADLQRKDGTTAVWNYTIDSPYLKKIVFYDKLIPYGC